LRYKNKFSAKLIISLDQSFLILEVDFFNSWQQNSFPFLTTSCHIETIEKNQIMSIFRFCNWKDI
jgi:phosphoribulokinase